MVYGDEFLPRYIGIIINHYKDPYKPTRIQWKVVRFFFFFVAHLGLEQVLLIDLFVMFLS